MSTVVRGEDALRALVALTATRDGIDPNLEPAASSARIAGWMQGELGIDATPRKVAAQLRRLADACLATNGPAARRLKSGRIKSYSRDVVWSPTARGREIDALLERITARRGGRFAGWSESGITISESIALR